MPAEADSRELVAAIVQDADSGRVLMLAWMDPEALRLTRETGLAHFYSRSRRRLWLKGETSGNTRSPSIPARYSAIRSIARCPATRNSSMSMARV